MINKKKIEVNLSTVLAHRLFKAEKYSELLKYLIACTLEENIPKETSIALDFFKLGPTELIDNSTVRVSIYNLRKRLREYYLTDGKNDSLHFFIKKGSYEVMFKEKEKEQQTLQFVKKYKSVYYALASLLLLLLGYSLSFILNDKPKKNPYENHMIYKSFSNNTKPILIVIGDSYVYQKLNSKNSLVFIRNYKINSDEDLLDEFGVLVGTDSNDIQKSKDHYLQKHHIVGSLDLYPLLRSIEKPIRFRMSSDLTLDDVIENNIIYLGLNKNMRLLEDYFFNQSNFLINKNKIRTGSKVYLSNKLTNEKIGIVGKAPEKHSDSPIFAKVTGPKNSDIYFIMSFTDTGAEKVCEEIIKPNFMKDTLFYGNTDCDFEILYEVKGYDRKTTGNLIIKQNYLRGDCSSLEKK